MQGQQADTQDTRRCLYIFRFARGIGVGRVGQQNDRGAWRQQFAQHLKPFCSEFRTQRAYARDIAARPVPNRAPPCTSVLNIEPKLTAPAAMP
jgi:hypothetical protein